MVIGGMTGTPARLASLLALAVIGSGSCCTADAGGDDGPPVVLDFHEAEAGVYVPSVDTEEAPRFEFFKSTPRINSRNPGSGPVLVVTYWEPGTGERMREMIELGFVPTAISGPPSKPGMVVLGGMRHEGQPTLRIFEFDFFDGFQVLVRDKPFGDVSGLASVTDLVFDLSDEDWSVIVLDGRTGKFGRVEAGREFVSLIPVELEEEIKGKRSITVDNAKSGIRTFYLSSELTVNLEHSRPDDYLGLRKIAGEGFDYDKVSVEGEGD